MRYPAAEKLEIIRLVEQSHLPTRQTLDKLGIPRRTFARWYARYLDGGPEALEDRPRRRAGCGTGCPMMCASRSSTWRWRTASSRRASWRQIYR
jgi:hypothetical protein